jgi:hypothetical protein
VEREKRAGVEGTKVPKNYSPLFNVLNRVFDVVRILNGNHSMAAETRQLPLEPW